MTFTFKDSFDSQTGLLDLGTNGTVSAFRKIESNINEIKIVVPYSCDAWRIVRNATHFLSEAGDRVRIKMISIQGACDDSTPTLCITGNEVNTVL